MSEWVAGAFSRDDDGDKFLVVHAEHQVIEDTSTADRLLRALKEAFDMPVLLASQLADGSFDLYGPRSLIDVTRRQGGCKMLNWGRVNVPELSLWKRTTWLSLGDIWEMLRRE